MFMPRSLKLKRHSDSRPNTPELKKSRDTSGDAAPTSSSLAAGFPSEEVNSQVTSESGKDEPQITDAPVLKSLAKLEEAEVEEEPQEEPVKSFKKSQRWPEPGEPVCVMCGRYGEYICDSTDNDVCSLECKASHLAKMCMGLGEKLFSKTKQEDTSISTASTDTVHAINVAGSHDLGYSYKEDAFIAELTGEQVDRVKKELSIVTDGLEVSRPIIEFEHCHFPEALSSNLKKAGYEVPTPIQMQMVPVGLVGRDVIATADTGSGKTIAFLLPVVVHSLEVKSCESKESMIRFTLHCSGSVRPR